jgi:hypothetical protein
VSAPWQVRGALLIPFCAAALISSAAFAQRPEDITRVPPGRWGIMTWAGTTAQWNQLLHATGTRVDCSGRVEDCADSLTHYSNGSSMRLFLEVPLPAQADLAITQQYAELAQKNRAIAEVAITNFTAQYSKFFTGDIQASSELNAFIDTLKSRSPGLGFGITLYEDDLTSNYLTDAYFPDSVRVKVDWVHLFIRFRANSPAFATYVHAVKGIFPHARIVAGVYAYDRIGVQSCAASSRESCSPQEEVSFFRTEFDQAIELLGHGDIDWLELYPPLTAEPGQVSVPNHPAVCTEQPSHDCIELTHQIWQIVADRFNQAFHTSAAVPTE